MKSLWFTSRLRRVFLCQCIHFVSLNYLLLTGRNWSLSQEIICDQMFRSSEQSHDFNWLPALRVWMIMFSPVWSITSKSGPADVCRGRLWTEFLTISTLNRTKTTEISFRVLIKDSLISDSPSSLHLRRLVRVWRSDSRPAAAPLHSDPVCTKTINQPAPEETPTVSEVLELIFLFLRSFIHSFGKMVHSGPIWEPELCNEVDFFVGFLL